MPQCHAITKTNGKRCTQTAKRRYCHRHREPKNRGVEKRERNKPEPRRTMSRDEKIKRWGKVVAYYRSRTSNKVYSVRKKGNKYSCNCPGWAFKKPGQARNCVHVVKAKIKLRRAARAAAAAR